MWLRIYQDTFLLTLYFCENNLLIYVTEVGSQFFTISHAVYLICISFILTSLGSLNR